MSTIAEIKQQLAARVNFNTAQYAQLARSIAQVAADELKPLRLGFLSNIALNLFAARITVEGAARGYLLKPQFSPFDQFESEALNPGSSLYRDDPQVIVIAWDWHTLLAPLFREYLRLKPPQRQELSEAVLERLYGLLTALRRHTEAALIVWNCPPLPHPVTALADAGRSDSLASAIANLNTSIAEVASQTPGVLVQDVARIATETGLQNFYDTRMALLARMPFTPAAQTALAAQLSRIVSAQLNRPRKCLVLDLDNTLWGGIVGEAGFEGIKLGHDYPGSAYLAFMYYLKALKDRGILLAIASKNNYEDAVKVFREHPDCPLSEDDFADLQIHWNDKASSMKAIAENLNIGVDSLVFLDDNPVEREWVASETPEVQVLDFPRSPDALIATVEDSAAFDRVRLTQEDLKRADYYNADKQRRALKSETDTLDEFLRGLQTRITLEPIQAQARSLERVVQLIGRTNQFNLTTRRHTEAELLSMLNCGALALSIRVADRFGEHGLVGVAIAVPDTTETGTWRVDTFLLSCRVMMRKVETALLGKLIESILKHDSKASKLIGEFIPTAKNKPVAQFYTEHGFQKQPDLGEGSYSASLKNPPFTIPDYFEFVESDTQL